MNPITFLGGLLLGLASSLHCAGMCGAIASSLTLTFAGSGGARDRAEALAAAQAGKTLAYVTAGALLGALGAGVYGLLDRQGGFFILQRVGAAGLAWVGLSMLGLAPPPSVFDRAFAPLRRWAWTARRGGRRLAAGVAGLVWGLLPCGMVYSALLYAMLSGTALSGGLVMLGFGLGVTPSVVAVALGVSWLPKISQAPWTRRAIGGVMIAIGGATLVWPMGGVVALCARVLGT
ncbi:sulfite exporter TauE/SafE family protein [Phenylobacterium aquaticum]|uniref:sulfite exporter TauE/SafE family protein n=1 Tax=Phenylobacterium aquaticum TaxID=1763816 RepID=UPI0026EC8CC0|nr:sulfite exporter TauE/SafE family protein [Phenylobacterium aquaticum]